ncbi:MAG: galactose oxidase-like domain-containing protein [Candidatus Acidiferrales bacterium]
MRYTTLRSILGAIITVFLTASLFSARPAQAAIAVDVSISVDQASAKTTVTTPAFSTASGNELLLAFVATDYLSGTNTQVNSVSGGSLIWQLVVRTNAQSGTSEIWRAFAPSGMSQVTVTATLSHSVVASLTVMSFTGVNTSGSNGSGAIGAIQSVNARSGVPTATLVTTQNGSWVFGVGNDWDNAIARTPAVGQSLVHQDLTSTGDTYWVQMQNSATALSGTSVTINDTAPSGDRFNLSIVEVVAASSGGGSTFSLSGALSPASLVSGSVVTLTLPSSGAVTTTPDGSGNYTFPNLGNGTYVVTPSYLGQGFVPTSQTEVISGNNATGINFALQTWNISGNITPTVSGNGTIVALTGPVNATAIDSSGSYTFSGLPNGSYTVTPSKTEFTFNPASLTVAISGGSNSTTNFTATAIPTWSISGTISPASIGSGALLILSGPLSSTVTADSSGNYSFTGVPNGSYTVTPGKTGATFTPASQAPTVNGAPISNLDFTAQTATTAFLAIDATSYQDVTSEATTVATPTFSTNSGNELLLAFIATDYLSGANTTVTGVSGGSLTWSLVKRTNVQSGTAEIWRAFASNPLSNVVVSASLSQKVLSSITVVTFTGVDTTGSDGSGAIGATASGNASSGAPTATVTTTRNNSWVFGVGDDFDKAVVRTLGPSQSMIHQFLTPLGDTYWVQRQTNTTPISGTTVAINDTAPTGDRYDLSIVEVLPALSGGNGTPPTVSITSPAVGATVWGNTTVTAGVSSQGSSITGVQFLLDQSNLGTMVGSAPFSFTWDTTTATSGMHTLSAIAYNSAGLSATSTPITVTVDNSGSVTEVGSWSSPVSIPTVAVNLILLKNNTLLFSEDGSSATVWDYVNNTFTSVPAPADLFCSGQAALADGRILMVGGYGGSSTAIGIPSAEIFDPSTNTWTAVPRMAYSRWYPSATTLSDGRIIVTGGWQTTEHSNAGIPEIYDPVANTWTQLTSANNPFETYPFIYMLSDGRLVHVNGSEYATVTDVLNLNTESWSIVDSNITDGGSSAMYLPDKIVKAGSATDSQESGPSSNTTFVLDMTAPSPAWQQTPSMAYPRSFLNLTELPDGTVLATGGETDKNGGNISNAVYPAELWSPATQTWTTMASMHTPREYHSTAVLLPDGRVLESGMGADFGNVPNELSAEFFSPPYLFKGTRPTISQAPAQISYGQNFFVGTPDAATITSAVLIRTGAVTHFFNMNARFVPVSFQQTTGGLTITAPANGYQAPPGYYLLFLVNSNGVPSVAPFVQLQ